VRDALAGADADIALDVADRVYGGERRHMNLAGEIADAGRIVQAAWQVIQDRRRGKAMAPVATSP
jgi:hypothetical protein